MSVLEPSREAAPQEHAHLVTGLLHQLSQGEADALQRLMPLVYSPLKRMAQRQMRRERAGHTLSPTALVHEAYLWLTARESVAWKDRVHFFAVAAVAMRRILVDHARRRLAGKRGGDRVHVPVDEEEIVADQRADILVALDAALHELESLDARLSRVVEYRFFGGMTEEEIAEVLGLTARTVRRDWVKARGWLRSDLTKRGVIAELDMPGTEGVYA